MEIRFKRMAANAVPPFKAVDGAAGYDLTVSSMTRSTAHSGNIQIKYYSGIAVEIPLGYVGLVFPRSSVCRKDNRMANAVGVIDHGYTGEISGVFDLPDSKGELSVDDERIYKIGERFAQLVIVPIPEVTFQEVAELEATTRGSGGYGSTGA